MRFFTDESLKYNLNTFFFHKLLLSLFYLYLSQPGENKYKFFRLKNWQRIFNYVQFIDAKPMMTLTSARTLKISARLSATWKLYFAIFFWRVFTLLIWFMGFTLFPVNNVFAFWRFILGLFSIDLVSKKGKI